MEERPGEHDRKWLTVTQEKSRKCSHKNTNAQLYVNSNCTSSVFPSYNWTIFKLLVAMSAFNIVIVKSVYWNLCVLQEGCWTFLRLGSRH